MARYPHAVVIRPLVIVGIWLLGAAAAVLTMLHHAGWGVAAAVLLDDDPKGLIASWNIIDQQGANEDGVTFIDAANEALEIDLPIRCMARDGVHLRQVVRRLWSAVDTKRTGLLSWWTPDLGYWFTPVRLFKPPAEGHSISGDDTEYVTTLRLRGDGGFWLGLDDVAEFRFAYDAMRDDFSTDYLDGLGPNWPVYLEGKGGGHPYVNKGMARWRDDPKRVLFTQGRTFVAGPYRDFETETDYQVIEIDLGTMLELGSAVDVMGRMGRTADGEWNGYGTRVRATGATLQVSAFNNFHETHIKTWPIFPPPLPRETLRVEFGDPEANDGEGDPRIIRLKRGYVGDGITALKAEDEAGIAPLGAQFRGVGWGSFASGAFVTQGTPAAVTEIRAGDASETTQSGYIDRINLGTEERRDRYTCYGPGTFEIASGPGSSEMVEFGPLLPNQVMRLNTDGQKQPIVDLTSTPSTAAELLEYRDALKELESVAPIANIGPTMAANASGFGVVPPQGNVNRLLRGRFARPLAPKPSGGPAPVQRIAVKISGGNSDSRIVAHGTPRRRYPQ